MYVDPRGLRVAAWLTAVVLAVVLVSGNGWLLLGQTVVFALGAFAGMRFAPYSLVFRYVVKPWLGPSDEPEPAAPPRFAQFVGFLFAAVGTVGYLAGSAPLGIVATSLALAAAFLNAAFGLCLGCQVFLLYHRLVTRHEPSDTTSKGVTA